MLFLWYPKCTTCQKAKKTMGRNPTLSSAPGAGSEIAGPEKLGWLRDGNLEKFTLLPGPGLRAENRRRDYPHQRRRGGHHRGEHHRAFLFLFFQNSTPLPLSIKKSGRTLPVRPLIMAGVFMIQPWGGVRLARRPKSSWTSGA